MTRTLLALSAALLLGTAARAGDGPHVQARLIVAGAQVTPGAELELGLVLTVAKGWHVYWRHPGESGAAPELELTLPAGLERAGDLRWPAPTRLVIPGDMVNHVYEGEVTLLVPVRVSAEAQPGPLVLRGRASWLVCDADVCVGEEAPVALTLEVVPAPAADAGQDAADAERLRRARATLPRPPAQGELELAWEGTTLRLTVPGARELTFFPATPEAHLPRDLATACHAEGQALRLTWPDAARGAQVSGHLRAKVGQDEVHLWVETPGPDAGAR